MFQIYLSLDDVEQATNQLKQIDYNEHPEYYLAAADYAYQINKNEPVPTILKLVASNTTSSNVKQVKPVVVILRNLIRVQYDSLPETAQDLLQNIVKSTKLLSIIKEEAETEWLFRISFNSALKAPKILSVLFFEQSITIWLMTLQDSNLDTVKNWYFVA